ncbi:carboxypeptidase-like regulatory domain-containing protein [Ancylomarina sp. YFZ004]
MIRILLLLLILFLFYNSSSATNVENDSLISISGQVVTSTGISPIPLAHLIIKGKRSGQICDSLGIFHLQVKQSDTLIISALGFKTQEWAVPFIFDTTLPLFFQIPLKKMAYLLKEVDVFALGTWDEFKADFVKLKIKDDNVINTQITKELAPFRTKKPNIVPPQYRALIEKPHFINNFKFLPAYLFTKLSRSEKRKRKITGLIRNKWKAKKLSQYYSSDIVAANTGLKGDRLEDFMAYCGPKMKITEITSQYDILEQIVTNYKKYFNLIKEKQIPK